MTREDAIKQLELCQRNRDTAVSHLDADAVLCTLLNSLGYDDLVAAWCAVTKWYS